MRASEYRLMSLPELQNRQGKLRDELARLNMKRYARRLDKSSDLGKAKRELARLLTVLNEKVQAAGAEVES